MNTRQPAYIVFQAYGSKSILQECLFALLTLSSHYPTGEFGNMDIWIYTDQPEFFTKYNCPLPLHFRTIGGETLQKWRGSIDFVHRVKIEILSDLTREKQGSILYLDSDICVLQSIDKLIENIEAGKRYMHVDEGSIDKVQSPIFRKLYHFINSNKIRLKDSGKEIMIPKGSIMWNAGVLGFRSGSLPLGEILEFTDAMYTAFPKHIIEQFAFSFYMQAQGNIYAASPYILHYWNLKELRIIIASFFDFFKDCKWDELVHYSQLIQVHVYMQQKANFYENRSLAGKIKKIRWVPDMPDWELSVKQLN